jgi:hypothetical protein
MVGVEAVGRNHLPVGADSVKLRAGDDAHSSLGLIENQVDIFTGRPEIPFERFNLGIEAYEIETAIVVEPWRLAQGKLVAVKIGRVSGGIRNSDQPSQVVERPCVVKALEGVSVAIIHAADFRAPVRATVVKYPHDAVFAAHEDERPSSDFAPVEIARMLNLGFVADIQPGPIEYAFPLTGENLLRGHDRTMNPEEMPLPVFDNEIFSVQSEVLVLRAYQAAQSMALASPPIIDKPPVCSPVGKRSREII